MDLIPGRHSRPKFSSPLYRDAQLPFAQVIGVCELDLAGSRFIQKPKHRTQMELDFISPPAMKKMKRLVEKSNKRAAKEQQKPPDVKDTGKVDEQGRKQYKIPEGPVGDEAKQEAEEKKVCRTCSATHFKRY